MSRTDRQTIFVEDAEIIKKTVWPEEQYVLRLSAPECARHARPGSFAHIRCNRDLPMRRPLSIMRANASAGWIEVLYKIVGEGLRLLSEHTEGQSVSVMGPIGNGFTLDPDRPFVAMIGGGVGIPPLVFLAEHLASIGDRAARSAGFFGSEIPFPFELSKQGVTLPGSPAAVTAGLADLDVLGVPNRLASNAGYPGCYQGFVTALADEWLGSIDETARARVTLYACGPEPMLEAGQAVARKYALPSQLCLEEFMACAVGGCAGCAVRVQTPAGPAMKRVCVDGPVFAGDMIYPA